MATLFHVRWLWNIPGPKTVSCGLDFESNLALDAADLTAIATASNSGYGVGTPTPQSQFTAGIVFAGTYVFAYDVEANSSPPPAFRRTLKLGPVTVTRSDAGTASGSSALPQSSQVVTFRTAISSKRTRGRIYLPPLPAGLYATDGRITETIANGLESSISGWIAFIEASASSGDTYTHSVVSLTSDDLVTSVTAYEVKRRVDTQRRRLTRSLDTPT